MVDEFPNCVAKNCFFDGRWISQQQVAQDVGAFVHRFLGISFLNWLRTFENKPVIDDVKDIIGEGHHLITNMVTKKSYSVDHIQSSNSYFSMRVGH